MGVHDPGCPGCPRCEWDNTDAEYTALELPAKVNCVGGHACHDLTCEAHGNHGCHAEGCLTFQAYQTVQARHHDCLILARVNPISFVCADNCPAWKIRPLCSWCSGDGCCYCDAGELITGPTVRHRQVIATLYTMPMQQEVMILGQAVTRLPAGWRLGAGLFTPRDLPALASHLFPFHPIG